MCIMYFKKKRKRPINLIVIVSAILIFLTLIVVFKNPFMEKRSGLGPIYFSVLFLFWPKIIKPIIFPARGQPGIALASIGQNKNDVNTTTNL